MEYPGYGICFREKFDIFKVHKRSRALYKYLVEAYDFLPKNIIVMGQSSAAEPAIYLATKFRIGLISLVNMR